MGELRRKILCPHVVGLKEDFARTWREHVAPGSLLEEAMLEAVGLHRNADDAAAAHEQRVEVARARHPESHAWQPEGGSLEDIAPLGGKVPPLRLARASLHMLCAFACL